MRILILSKEVWRDEQNGGNVLSNMFAGFDAEIAQIYCSDGMPNNSICKKYYQISESRIVASFKHKTKIGQMLEFAEFPHEKSQNTEIVNRKKISGYYLRIARELVWKLARLPKKEIKQFVTDFNPDVIFAPCYGCNYMVNLLCFINSFCKKPIVSIISDDFYTVNNYSFKPSFWIFTLALRKNIRKVFKLYNTVYTMTEEQKLQCEKDFGANMKILRKSASFGDVPVKETVNSPVKLVYAGGIYLGRWKTLGAVADAIRTVNAEEKKIQLDIYTANELDEEMSRAINDGINSTVHGIVSLKELGEIYKNSDIALHVESFDESARKAVKLSFSTKIVDCLSSGCAVMAICGEEQAGFKYLLKNDAAICISNPAEIKGVINGLTSNSEKIIEYQKKARELCIKNHTKSVNDNMIYEDFVRVIDEDTST